MIFRRAFSCPISSKIFASSSLAGSADLVHVFFRLRGKVQIPVAVMNAGKRERLLETRPLGVKLDSTYVRLVAARIRASR